MIDYITEIFRIGYNYRLIEFPILWKIILFSTKLNRLIGIGNCQSGLNTYVKKCKNNVCICVCMLHDYIKDWNQCYLEKISKGFEQKLASFGLKTPPKDQMGNQMAIAKLSQTEPSWAKKSHCKRQ